VQDNTRNIRISFDALRITCFTSTKVQILTQKEVQDNTRNIRISFDALRSGALALQVKPKVRMLPYAAVCCRMLPYATVCCRMLPYAALCWASSRLSTGGTFYADVC
jgi:hypothetical protein